MVAKNPDFPHFIHSEKSGTGRSFSGEVGVKGSHVLQLWQWLASAKFYGFFPLSNSHNLSANYLCAFTSGFYFAIGAIWVVPSGTGGSGPRKLLQIDLPVDSGGTTSAG